MSSALPAPVVDLVEVGPRDGLQNESRTLPVETRIELVERLVERLVAAGVRRLEAVSLVPRRGAERAAGTACDELDEAIGTWTRQHDRDEVPRLLDEDRVRAGAIFRAEDIVHDEQYLSRGMVQDLEVDVDGERPLAFPGIVPLLGERSLPIRHPGPDLGADTRWLLEEVLGRAPSTEEETG